MGKVEWFQCKNTGVIHPIFDQAKNKNHKNKIRIHEYFGGSNATNVWIVCIAKHNECKKEVSKFVNMYK